MWLSLAKMHKKAWWERKTHPKYFFETIVEVVRKKIQAKIVFFRKDMREKKVESENNNKWKKER